MLKWIAMSVAPVALAGGAYLHGPFTMGGGASYAMPSAQVAATLETMSLPDYVTGTLNTLPSGGSSRMAVPGRSVTYLFQARGAQAAKYVVEIVPVDATHTRVSGRMEMGDQAETLMKAKYMPVAKEFKVIGAAAMAEQIDAKLSGRPVNPEVVKKAYMTFGIANMGAIQEGVSEAMDEAVKLQEQSHAAGSQQEFVPGQPMSDPTLDTTSARN
jgi:hypothetical protein